MEHRHASTPPKRVQLHCLDETRTVQSEAESCEINNIMAKYERTGVLEHAREGGRYEDLPAPMEYQEALNRVMEAEQSFDGLPAGVRKEFDNDPTKFLSFVENPENVDRMIELGLATAVEQPPIIEKAEANKQAAAAEGDAAKSSPKSEIKSEK